MDKKLCRLCCENDANQSIFLNKDNELPLSAKIMYCCVNINVREEDDLPSFVCNVCERELDACYRFVLKCEESDKKLRASVFTTDSTTHVINDDKSTKVEIKSEVNGADDNDTFSDGLDFQYEDLKHDENFKEEVNGRVCGKKRPYKKRTKHKKLDVVCSVCGRKCSCPSALVIHMRIHTNEKPFHCSLCEKSYKDSGSLKKHFERNHLKDKRERNFICEHCGKGFYSKNDVKIHMRVHTGETPYICSICSARFTQISAMLRHKLRHTGEKTHKCPTCSKCFCTKQELKNHLSVHNNERKYSCPVCNVLFKQKSNLKKHLKLHSEPNRFVCNYCGRTFNMKGNLKSHIDRKHSENSGYCSICCKNVSNIEVHMWRHTGQRPLKCELCTSSFYELKALAHHVNFKHKKTDKYKCIVEGCSMSFPSRPMLDFHTAKTHETQIPFPCDRCSRGFYRKNDLARHKIGTHKERLL